MMIATESPWMRGLRRLGFERLAWSLRRLHCPVGKEALVLEVGSGGNPYPRSNVLLDAYEATRERHWAPLKADRPTVLGLAESLPFKDQVFDFVIASHVLEHSTNPEQFLGELQRVARAGYIEVPDAFMERINPYRDHRLEITTREQQLVIRKKPGWRTDPELVELYEHRAKSVVTRDWIPANPFLFHVRYYWESTIQFTVVNPDTDANWSAPTGDMTGTPPRQGLRGTVLDALRAMLSQSSRNRAIDLGPLLRCPNCRQASIDQHVDELACGNCHAVYPVEDGIPRLFPKHIG